MSEVIESPNNLDEKNMQFWDELCGSGLARMLNINEITPETLKIFDAEFYKMYPYLKKYVDNEELAGKKVLEVGLGFGSLSGYLGEVGSIYHGLDIAQNPCDMVKRRLEWMGKAELADNVQQGSVLDLPYADETFDHIYTIGCLHHTGDVEKSVAEVCRTLKKGGKATVMLYNKNSFRQLCQVGKMRLKNLFQGRKNLSEKINAMYDTNEKGEAAPHIDYTSKAEVRELFKEFEKVSIDIQNFDTYVLYKGKLIIRRENLLNNLARILGLDLYIVAKK